MESAATNEIVVQQLIPSASASLPMDSSRTIATDIAGGKQAKTTNAKCSNEACSMYTWSLEQSIDEYKSRIEELQNILKHERLLA